MYKDYTDYPEIDEINHVIAQVARDYKIPFWIYNKSSLCKSKEYFKDLTHLNSKGADEFSKIFAGDVKKNLPENIYTK